MTTTSEHPEGDGPEIDFRGKRLLPTWIDKVGREEPDRVWASMPRTTSPKDGFRDLKYCHLVAAIDATAWWIESVIGRSSQFETVAYMGIPDLRYNIIPVALIKTGHKTLFMSHRNRVAGHKELMGKTQCNTLFYSEGTDYEPLVASGGMRSFKVEKLDDLLYKQGTKAYQYNKTFEEAARDPIAVVHTSGSTGMPKPILWNHGIYATIDAQSIPESLEGRRNVYQTMKECKRHYSTMPLSHSSGLVRFLRAIFLEVVLVVGPPDRLVGPDPDSLTCVNQILDHGSVDAANFLPSTLEALCAFPQSLKHLSKLRFIGFGGAPLAKSTGDILRTFCKNTTLHNSLGSTDGGAFVTYEPDPEDWQYICYCPIYNGIEWRPAREDLYEMIIRRDPRLEKFQSCFKTHFGLHEWSTRDLYSKHPTKPHHWRHEARVDDLIVSANGAKFNPLSLQARIEQCAAVKFALVAGNHRLRPGVILQLHDPQADEDEKQKVYKEVWAIVSETNKKSPSQGRIMKSLIMFTKPDKAFPLAGKGTVQKALAEKMYEKELDELYKAAGPKASYSY